MFHKVSTKRIKQRWNSTTEAMCVLTKTWIVCVPKGRGLYILSEMGSEELLHK